jgi:hypothetical protein
MDELRVFGSGKAFTGGGSFLSTVCAPFLPLSRRAKHFFREFNLLDSLASLKSDAEF